MASAAFDRKHKRRLKIPKPVYARITEHRQNATERSMTRKQEGNEIQALTNRVVEVGQADYAKLNKAHSFVCRHDLHPFTGVPWYIVLDSDRTTRTFKLLNMPFCSVECKKTFCYYHRSYNFQTCIENQGRYQALVRPSSGSLLIEWGFAPPQEALQLFHAPGQGLPIDEFRSKRYNMNELVEAHSVNVELTPMLLSLRLCGAPAVASGTQSETNASDSSLQPRMGSTYSESKGGTSSSRRSMDTSSSSSTFIAPSDSASSSGALHGGGSRTVMPISGAAASPVLAMMNSTRHKNNGLGSVFAELK